MNIINVNNLKHLCIKVVHSRTVQRLLKRNNLEEVSPKNVVLITGCDSGLGFNLALLCHSMNMTVISGCLNTNSDGAKLLRSVRDPKRMITLEINLLKEETIFKASTVLRDLISSQEYEFTALVNNAGVMYFGEFEWQTNSLFEKQIQVNLVGTMKFTKELLPLIRQQKSRIINVTSHCGIQSLPGLAPYAASKAGLKFWNDALRIELKKYGVHVINFVPGSLIGVTNITSGQAEAAKEMWQAFSSEQIEFYEEYFKEYNNYLKALSGYKSPTVIGNMQLLNKFKSALLDKSPKSLYKNEPIRYKLYFFVIQIFPTLIADWFTEKFVKMPEYHPKIKNF